MIKKCISHCFINGIMPADVFAYEERFSFPCKYTDMASAGPVMDHTAFFEFLGKAEDPFPLPFMIIKLP